MDPLDTRRNRPAETNAEQPLRETASQTAGPYVHIGCLPNMAGISEIYPDDLISNQIGSDNKIIKITGQVFEGEGVVCRDVMLEFWHANENGSFESGVWRRAGTDLETGQYEIETVMPGAFTDTEGNRLAPFVYVWVVARGINIGLLTRIYFPDYSKLNSTDTHFQLVDEQRRKTLLAEPTSETMTYRFNVHLQGEAETVFFEV